MSYITDIIVFEFSLQNSTDLIIGHGQGETVDLEVVLDDYKKPYIPGSSIAGALLNFSKPYEKIFQNAFIELWGADEKHQSHINISPAKCTYAKIETKEAVKICKSHGVGITGGKFNYQRVVQGAKFSLKIEIKIRNGFDRENVLSLVDLLVNFIQSGKFRVGAKENKSYGFLKCLSTVGQHFKAKESFDDYISYLNNGSLPNSENNLILNPNTVLQPIEKNTCTFSCDAFLYGGIFTAGKKEIENKASIIYSKKRKRNGVEVDWLDAESILGPIRHEYFRIWNTVKDEETAKKKTNSLFGYVSKETAQKHRIKITPSQISGVKPLTQTNIKINGWTGATVNSALITHSYPYRVNDNKNLSFKVTIENPTKEELKTIILVLRNLATGIFGFGAKKSTGRGFCKKVKFKLSTNNKELSINEPFVFSETKQDIPSILIKKINSYEN